MSRIALYSGSFDPITVGHLDVITRGCKLFDEVIVAIGENPAKKTMFTLAEREALVTEVVAPLGVKVRVVSFEGLLVDAVKREGADLILRGLRVISDFDSEFRNGLANRDMAGVETLFLLTEPSNIFVSSSIVKEIAVNGGDISRYAPEAVQRAIKRKVRSKS
jgi:pantetheine-phosphate adenylyltransferase